VDHAPRRFCAEYPDAIVLVRLQALPRLKLNFAARHQVNRELCSFALLQADAAAVAKGNLRVSF
jgi:hypothetical protein